MINLYLTIALAVVMAFAVFFSMPLVFYRKMRRRHMIFLNAGAIGILVFLLMDIYGDVAQIFGNDTITNPLELTFLLGFIVAFLFFIIPRGSRDPEENPKRTSILAAIGIGFQNLTEGLLFGSASAAGLISIYALSAVGFTLQNVTEGFPIAAPLFGSKERMERKFVSFAFLIGGLPTLIGTLIGLVFFSNMFIIFFDALASAAILYVVLVLFNVNANSARSDGKKATSHLMLLNYSGILIGFVIAYVLNYVVVA